MLVVNHLDGSHDVLAPSPGPAYDEAGERRFVKANNEPWSWSEAAERIARWRKQDPDVWIVEVEDRNGLGGAKLVKE